MHPPFLSHLFSFPLVLLFCTPSYFIFYNSAKICVSFTWFPGKCFAPYMDSVRYILLLPHFSGEAEGHTHTAHAALEPVTPGTRIQTQTLMYLLARNPSSVMVKHSETAYALCRNEGQNSIDPWHSRYQETEQEFRRWEGCGFQTRCLWARHPLMGKVRKVPETLKTLSFSACWDLLLYFHWFFHGNDEMPKCLASVFSSQGLWSSPSGEVPSVCHGDLANLGVWLWSDSILALTKESMPCTWQCTCVGSRSRSG